MTFLIILATIVWYITGLIANGFFLAYSQKRFKLDWNSDRNYALIVAVLGPCCFTGAFLIGTTYGWINPLGKNPNESQR